MVRIIKNRYSLFPEQQKSIFFVPGAPKSIFFVPGAYELPFLAKKLCEGFDAIILLGCIIKGETPHFEIISQSVSDKVLEASLSENKPIIFGVLTTNNDKEAIERAAYKGTEFADSALSILETISKIK